jgi:hypothetical protein
MLILSGCNGVSGDNGADPFNPDQVIPPSIIKIGYFDETGQFVDNVVGVSLADENGLVEISAGGSVGLSVALVDEDNVRVTEPYLVEFTSNCVAAEKAILVSGISTVNGEASSTYTDDGCAGVSGTTDQITATVLTDNDTITAIKEIGIRPEVLGGISFSSASSQTIILQGAGDAAQSKATVTFVVSNDRGQPLPSQQVAFSLTTEAGGLRLSSVSGTSDDNGEVTTQVIAGDVPVSVRVTAKVVAQSGEEIVSQSDPVLVSTGLPNQRSFTLSSDIYNIEAGQINGVTANLTVQLSDLFNNPVPDDTVVNFTAEGGSVISSCVTTDGSCTVLWTSADPRPADGRATILATAIGHETLFDSNGNNVYDDEDGVPLSDDANAASGFGVSPTGEFGFVDYSEAWLDANEDGLYNSPETFLDYYKNGVFDEADGVFNGPQCQSATLCGQEKRATAQVRKSIVLVMSGSNLIGDVYDNAGQLYASNSPATDRADISIAKQTKQKFTVVFNDFNGQMPPFESTFSMTTSDGAAVDITTDIVPNTNKAGGFRTQFSLENTQTEDVNNTSAAVFVNLTTPSGVISQVSFTINLE